MKCRRRIPWILGLALAMALAAQSAPAAADEVTKYFTDAADGGDCVLDKVVLSAEGESLKKTFFFEVPQAGTYFLSAWARRVAEQDQIVVYLDADVLPLGVLPTPEDKWQSALLTGIGGSAIPVFFSAGAHTLTFRTADDTVPPAVDWIRIGPGEPDASIPDAEYESYLDELETGELSDDHYHKDEISEDEIGEGDLITSKTFLKGLMAPQNDYMYDLDRSFTYTYYGYFYLRAGRTVTFQTGIAWPFLSDPVMYLFNYFNPSLGSWSDDDGGLGLQSKITVTPSTSGWYMLMLRGYGWWHGFAHLYMDGRRIVPYAAIRGRYSYCHNLSKTGELNYFTAKLLGDSRLWVVDSNTFPGLVKAQNDDYWGSGNWWWGWASRVKATITPEVKYVVVGAYSSWMPWGWADFYMKCSNSTIMPWFPNLMADDAIRSAPTSGTYNCISWTGYITTYWVWPPSPSSTWYDPDPLTAFDNYYRNNPPRYPGACTYTRSLATSNNSVVDLWALNGSYTHGSIRKPGCGFPHGYDWESKPGSLMRTFHPRHDLSGSFYGQVDKYYRLKSTGVPKDVPTKSGEACLTYEEAERAGLVRREMVGFDEAESAKLGALVAALPADVRADFDHFYSRWKATWKQPEIAIESDPRKYAASPEYAEFLKFCEYHGEKIWPLLFVGFSEGDLFVVNAIEDLTMDRHGALMEQVRQESRDPGNRFDERGTYLAPSLEANVMNYVKRVLREF